MLFKENVERRRMDKRQMGDGNPLLRRATKSIGLTNEQNKTSKFFPYFCKLGPAFNQSAVELDYT